MALDLTTAISGLNLGSLIPSSSDIVQNVALGAASSVVLAGLKAQAGSGALDPLGLFPQQHAAPIAATNNPAVASGATITASAFAQLPGNIQLQLTTAGVHIVAG